MKPTVQKTLTVASCTIIALLLAASWAQAHYVKSGSEFVTKASVAGLFEIESSKLALEKSSNADVRDLAQQMIDDHEKANAELKATLPNTQVDASAAKDSLDKKHARLMDKLEGAKAGPSFDRQYLAIQKDAHKEAVSLFQNYAKHGDDAQLRQFASQTLPTLEMHLQHVKELK